MAGQDAVAKMKFAKAILLDICNIFGHRNYPLHCSYMITSCLVDILKSKICCTLIERYFDSLITPSYDKRPCI